MAKLLYSFTMSLDGYIAGPGGDMSWLSEVLQAPNPVADRLVEDIGCLLVGANTHEGDDPNKGTDKEGAFGGTYSGPVVVVTHRPAESSGDVKFVRDLDQGIAAAREAAGDKYVNVLGADVARQCLERQQIDEIVAFVAPVLLGDGVRVLHQKGGLPITLERLRDDRRASSLWYRVAR